MFYRAHIVKYEEVKTHCVFFNFFKICIGSDSCTSRYYCNNSTELYSNCKHTLCRDPLQSKVTDRKIQNTENQPNSNQFKFIHRYYTSQPPLGSGVCSLVVCAYCCFCSVSYSKLFFFSKYGRVSIHHPCKLISPKRFGVICKSSYPLG